MLPSALWKLIRLQRRAAFKRVVRGIKTPRGATFFAIGVLMILLWFAPTLRALIRGEHPDPVPIRTFLPPALFLLCAVNVLSSAGEQAVAFMPAEVDLLFAAPFTRRQLLGYKIAQSALSALTVATLFSVIWLKYGGPWIAAWIGYAMTMLFSRLVGMAGTLIGQAAGERAYTRGRRMILFALLALVALVVWPLVREGFNGSPREWIVEFGQSKVGAAILAPFRVFAMLVTAEKLYPDALRYFAIAAAIIAALIVVVMWLDVHYLETAAAAGAQVYAKIQRARSGAALISPAKPRAVRWRPPKFPRFGGAGPIARRQLTAALRQSRGVFVLMLIVCAVGVVLLAATKGQTDLTGPVVGGIVWVTLMLTNNLRFDFRGDADLIDTLKALPVRPAAVVAAELAAPALLLWFCQVILVSAAVALGRVPTIMLPLAAAFALPLDVMLIGLENLMFLLAPVRMQSSGVGDVQGYGRQVVLLLLKMVVMFAAAGVAAAAGFVAYLVNSGSTIAMALSAGAVLAIEAFALIPILARVYEKFDPSIDVPT